MQVVLPKGDTFGQHLHFDVDQNFVVFVAVVVWIHEGLEDLFHQPIEDRWVCRPQIIVGDETLDSIGANVFTVNFFENGLLQLAQALCLRHIDGLDECPHLVDRILVQEHEVKRLLNLLSDLVEIGVFLILWALAVMPDQDDFVQVIS